MGLGLSKISPSLTDWLSVYNRNVDVTNAIGDFISPQASIGAPSSIRTRTSDGTLADAIRIVPQSDQTLKIYLGRVGDAVSMPAFDFALPNTTLIPTAQDTVLRLKALTEVQSGGVYVDSSLTLQTTTVQNAVFKYEDTDGVSGISGSAFQLEHFPTGTVSGLLTLTLDGVQIRIPCFRS